MKQDAKRSNANYDSLNLNLLRVRGRSTSANPINLDGTSDLLTQSIEFTDDGLDELDDEMDVEDSMVAGHMFRRRRHRSGRKW